MRSTALVYGTGLVAALLVARVVYTGRTTYAFLLFNLALAWIPWVCARAAAALARERTWAAWAMTLLWLLFLPNAPYLVTDLLHLRPRPPAPLWYDVALLGSAALTGLFAGGISLRAMHAWIAERHGSIAASSVVAASIAASGLGIYLGRFDRFHSWDVLFDPLGVLRAVRDALTSPRALAVGAVFSAIILLAYVALGADPRSRPVKAVVGRRTGRSRRRPTR